MTSILKVDTIQDIDGNNIINESSDTITIGASGDTVNIVGTLQNNGSGLISGITQADVWRLNTNLGMSNAGLTKITANLERDDTAGFDYIGTGMTQSSGNFSFPSTGIYYIEAKGMIYGNSIGSTSDYNNVAIFTSINSGSTFTQRGNAPVIVSGTSYNNSYNHCFFDVTNTSTHQVAFYQDCHINGVQLIGNTTQNSTSFTFIRLGDT